MTFRFPRRLAALAAIGMACAALTTPSQATHSWNGYHWARTTSQFTLQLGNNLTTTDWKSHLSQASSDWNNGGNTPILTTIVAGGTTAKGCKMVAGTTQVCNAKYGNNGWLGLASINITGGVHITQGTAKMNDTYFASGSDNTPNEREHVMCQEVAHTFGLDHQSTSGASLNTCMDYFSNTGSNAGSTKSTKPNQHDFDELNTIYAHLDSFNTGNSMGAFGLQAATDSAAVDITEDHQSWGSLMRQSAEGRSSYYVRDNVDGSQTVTHVYWTRAIAQKCPQCDHRFHQ